MLDLPKRPVRDIQTAWPRGQAFPRLTHRVRNGLIGLICLGVLLAVLTLYLQPDFLLTLSNQVWGCF